MKQLYQIERLVQEIKDQIFEEQFEPVMYCGKTFFVRDLGAADCGCCSYYVLEVDGVSVASFAPWQIGDVYDVKEIIQKVTQ